MPDDSWDGQHFGSYRMVCCRLSRVWEAAVYATVRGVLVGKSLPRAPASWIFKIT